MTAEAAKGASRASWEAPDARRIPVRQVVLWDHRSRRFRASTSCATNPVFGPTNGKGIKPRGTRPDAEMCRRTMGRHRQVPLARVASRRCLNRCFVSSTSGIAPQASSSPTDVVYCGRRKQLPKRWRGRRMWVRYGSPSSRCCVSMVTGFTTRSRKT